MSYILEALRKSEQERNPEKVPDLSTHHPQILKTEKPRYAYWIIAVLFLIIIGMMLFYFFYNKPAEQQVVESPVAETVPVISNDNMSKPVVDNNINEAATFSGKIVEKATEQQKVPAATIITEKEVEQAPTFKVEAPVTKPAISDLDRAALQDISELNYDFQRQIPDMEFSTHIYVSDGGSFVIINGKTLSEGMAISRGLVIHQIISDGVVLEFRGRRFFLASMTNWQQN